MRIWKLVLAVLLPPLAVWDKGCGTILMVTLLTVLFWIPGVIAALLIIRRDLQRLPDATEDRSADLLDAAQAFKSQPIAPEAFASDTQPTIQAQSAEPAEPFEQPEKNPQQPAKPKPPWEE